ncbi:MAG: GerMN domain-containing protein, partial [bacterium]|nr:GerMN domain-containing protein [bacterium]
MRGSKLFLALAICLSVILSSGCAVEQSRNLVNVSQSTLPLASREYVSFGDQDFVIVYGIEKTVNYLIPASFSEANKSLTPIERAINLLNSEYDDGTFRVLGNRFTKIEGYSLDKQGVLTLGMGGSFQNWINRNLIDERNFVQATVLTFTSFRDIVSVQLTANGVPISGMISSQSLSKPISRSQVINTSSPSSPSAVLYLRLKGSKLLVPITRSVDKREVASVINELVRF